ncbi:MULTISPECIES: HK97 family phage prohead protease [unclassified Mesorhizobium]|uniref:HK97 family phage prohead protease n=1 Tax=unclassified Mesorhizobium TaxID=325217 RepID=UPI001CCE7303|nr:MULTISPECIES: HK97 family phage prohead protease [unclassified Mesorhizobium]MBZ9741018.1 HK97 family phage prohead protease [Mesorhizobium sp. CO1-1-4]MBZ9804373.1 HK97 family phage prohead protease [Mesorhizobium sp. ES1-6]
MADNVISGYAVRFGDITTIADFRERIAPGAFTRTLRQAPDVVMLLDHDSGRVLGRTSSGSLTLQEDATGLYFSLDVDSSTPEGQTAIGTVARRDVRGCSFGFYVRSESWQDDGDSLPLRTIEDVDLYEITLTAFPAYETTSASLSGRSGSVRRAEAAMRKQGIAPSTDAPSIARSNSLAASRRRAEAAMRLRRI